MPIYPICTFFKYEKKNFIACEAGNLHFPNHKGKRTLSANFCETFNYEECKRYQRLVKIYEE